MDMARNISDVTLFRRRDRRRDTALYSVRLE